MPVYFEVNGTPHEAVTGGSRDIEDRLRMSVSGPEVYIDVRTSDGGTRALHILPGSIGTYSVWESEKHSGHQS